MNVFDCVLGDALGHTGDAETEALTVGVGSTLVDAETVAEIEADALDEGLAEVVRDPLGVPLVVAVALTDGEMGEIDGDVVADVVTLLDAVADDVAETLGETLTDGDDDAATLLVAVNDAVTDEELVLDPVDVGDTVVDTEILADAVTDGVAVGLLVDEGDRVDVVLLVTEPDGDTLAAADGVTVKDAVPLTDGVAV